MYENKHMVQLRSQLISKTIEIPRTCNKTKGRIKTQNSKKLY